jgi:cytochrome c oxidase accessory protein FixG
MQERRTTAVPDGRGFRDSLGIVNREGKRKWIYPKQIVGRFYHYRTLVSFLLLALLFGIPFLRIGGHPFMLFNILERKFILFGQMFGPHDFYLFGLALIACVVFVMLFTVVFGRLFCGWVCPQTIFMEMVFRKIDSMVEGDHRRQRHWDASSWTAEKIARKGVKYLVYSAIAFLIANTLLAYGIGTDALFRLVTEPPSEHIAGLSAALGFSAVFYWIFVWFREQACILVCPYGRLQGVLLDGNSIVIAYDHIRGEPRGKLRRRVERTQGDCIDCDQCVEVCPTGIDIRNGTQLECVNCTACIDACDMVMDKVGRPRGLVRYDSADGIVSGKRRLWTPRVVGYTVLLALLSSVLIYLLAVRTPLDVTVLRTPGMFYQEQPDGRISNVYDIKVLNKTFDVVPLTLRLLDPPGEIRLMGDALRVPAQETAGGKLLLLLPRGSIHRLNTPVRIGVYAADREIDIVSTSFLGPAGTP